LAVRLGRAGLVLGFGLSGSVLFADDVSGADASFLGVAGAWESVESGAASGVSLAGFVRLGLRGVSGGCMILFLLPTNSNTFTLILCVNCQFCMKRVIP
jgi:hypothetical protein